MTLLADRCVEVLDVATAGIMLAGPGGELRVMTSSSDAMRVLELFEVQAQEGPCLDCYRTGRPVLNHVLAADGGRWPRFTAEALEAGFQSVQALPLRLRGNIIGALNMFHTDQEALAEGEAEIAQAFADVATIAILQHRAGLEGQVMNEQLQQALNSRVLIEQAKGVTAERAGLSIDEAFRALRSHARNHNLGLVSVAQGVIDGTLHAAELGAAARADDA
ncbi:MAG: GAF and ANTAR domain-containing protein [Acidimicrobiales bacterium]|nr:GAF and ANTAR domain-containing protein [Acidimicrobiales bacterium]